jgi:hypothetical protein
MEIYFRGSICSRNLGNWYYGALDYGNKEFLVQPYKKGDSSNTISFLKFLIKQRLNSRLTIIWEGASYHKSQELRDYLDLVNKGKKPREMANKLYLICPRMPLNKIQ